MKEGLANQDAWIFAKKKKVEVQALMLGHCLLIPPCRPLTFMERLFHEAGHVVGRYLSFKDGDVLTPDEAKQTKVEGIDFNTYRWLIAAFALNIPVKQKLFLEFAGWVLQTFTKGNMDLSVIKVYPNFPAKEIERIVKRRHRSFNTIDLNKSGEIVPISSKFGRNEEVPADAVMIGCIQIMSNTLDLPIIYKNIKNPVTSHERSHNIAHYAYTHGGIVLPSYVDMIATKDGYKMV